MGYLQPKLQQDHLFNENKNKEMEKIQVSPTSIYSLKISPSYSCKQLSEKHETVKFNMVETWKLLIFYRCYLKLLLNLKLREMFPPDRFNLCNTSVSLILSSMNWVPSVFRLFWATFCTTNVKKKMETLSHLHKC